MAGKKNVLIFGESVEGEFQRPFLIKSLPDLATIFGEPTKTGLGIHMAIQSLLFGHNIFFYRVSEEGNNKEQYLQGFKLFEREAFSSSLSAIALPGVGSLEILHAANILSELHKVLIITTEKDLYDLITNRTTH